MTMVFDRYPEGGNERLLALALADHARDDGSRIWPSVSELARKTVLSRSTVQRLLRRMTERGWLEQVHTATGRPGDTNEYRIHAAWIAGEPMPQRGVNLTPLCAPESVDNVIHTGVTTDERGVTTDERGVTAMTPESSGTIKNRNTPLPPVDTGGCEQLENPKPENPKPGSPSPGKGGWRWRDTFDGVRKRGGQLGVPYSEAPLGTAWTDDQLRAHQARYRALVDAAHDAHAQAQQHRRRA